MEPAKPVSPRKWP